MMTLQLPDGSEHDIDEDDDVQRIIVQYLWKQDPSTLQKMPLPTFPNGKRVLGRDKSDLKDKEVEQVEGTALWIGRKKRLGWALNRMNILIECCGQNTENYRLSLGRLGSKEDIN